MADLLSILSGAQSSLAAQRALQATAANNIDNASTPGYARQRVAIDPVVSGDYVRGTYLGGGATAGAVTQARDRFLEAQIPAALGAATSSATESDALAAVHALDPGVAGGVGNALASFYSGLRALAQDPTNSSLRSGALGAAQALAASFQQTRGALEDARGGLDQQLAASAAEANSEAAAVADLNGRIRAASGAGGTPNDLLDLRQKHLDRLAELTGASFYPSSNGDVNVALPGGAALVSGSAAGTLSAVADPANGGHLALQLTMPGAGKPAALAAAPGGQLGGTLAARDGAIGAAVQGLDGLAANVAATANAVHAAGTYPGAAAGVGGGPLFTPPPVDPATGAIDATRYAATMSVAVADASKLATVSPSGGAFGNNAQALVATESAAFGNPAQTAEATLAGITSAFGASAERARAVSDQEGALKDHLSTLRESASGVSIDDEMIQLQQVQRGYEAITKVIQVADQMMETLLQLK
jgi:flagellar hook-associated protein 1 FlgK